MGRQRDRLLVRAGLLVGLACPFKLVNLPGIAALALTLGLVALVRGTEPSQGAEWEPAGGWSRRRTPGSALEAQFATRMRGAIRVGLLVCVAALAALAPWLVKNLYFFHTFFYGLAVQVSAPAAGSVAVSAAAQESLGGHAWWIARNLVDIAWSCLGPLSPLLLAAPLLAWGRKGRDAAGPLSLFLVISGVLWLLIVPRFVEPRYYVGPLAVGAILLGAMLAAILEALPSRRRRVAELPLVGYLALALLLALSVGVQQAVQNRAATYALGTVSRDDYLAARVRPYAAERWADRHLPGGAMLVLLAVTRGYYLDHPHLAEVYHERRDRLDVGGATRASELSGWCRAGVRYAILDRGHDELDSMSDIRPLGNFAWSHLPWLHVRVLFSAHGVDVLSVTPCPGQSRTGDSGAHGGVPAGAASLGQRWTGV